VSCPVCGMTMQNLGSPERRIWWCSGCGTLKEKCGDLDRLEMPANLRHVLERADLPKATFQSVTATTVTGIFEVRREDYAQPTIKLALYDAAGRRVF
jgi:hypothetical protein